MGARPKNCPPQSEPPGEFGIGGAYEENNEGSQFKDEATGEERKKRDRRAREEERAKKKRARDSSVGRWTAHYSKKRGRIFYHNKATGETRWSAPSDFKPEDLGQSKDREGKGTRDRQEQQVGTASPPTLAPAASPPPLASSHKPNPLSFPQPKGELRGGAVPAHDAQTVAASAAAVAYTVKEASPAAELQLRNDVSSALSSLYASSALSSLCGRLEINDWTARERILALQSIKVVEAACGVAITQKGIYGGGQLDTRTEKLHLVIEGDSERRVQEAKDYLMHIAQGPQQVQAAKDHAIHYAQAPKPQTHDHSAHARQDHVIHDQMATTNAAQDQPPQTLLAGGTRACVGLDPSKMKHSKIFVGGLSQCVDNAGLRAYFETYGPVYDVQVKTDSLTGRSRGGDRRHVGARVIDRCD